MAADDPSPEIPTAESGDDLDDFPESFRCCVCLELLYKPIVLVCGHASCFWCVHHAMNSTYVSNCPICRHPYLYFPSICLLLHHLLFKISPIIYERRKKTVLEEENRTGFFSPDIPPHLSIENSDSGNVPDSQKCVPVSVEKSSWVTADAESEPFLDLPFVGSEQTCQKNTEDMKDVAVTADDFHKNVRNESSKQVTVADVLCSSCNQLLIQPVVLNCGHVYCKTCLEPLNETSKCQVCQSPHPSECPKVCLELDHFLEEQFPADYLIRRESIHHKLINCQKDETIMICKEQEDQGKKGSKSYMKSKIIDIDALGHGNSYVNAGIGCDSCGMYPIIGKCYRCMDCPEKVGFDLCEGCYGTKSKLPGRFNQRHTADHQLKLVQPEMIHRIVLQLMVDNDPVYPVPSDDESDRSLEDSPSTS